MTAIPRLTDPKTLSLHRARARRMAVATFLHEAAIAEIQDRLDLVNRRFTDIAIVTGWPEIWAAAFPGARIVPDDAVLDLTVGAQDLVIHAMALHWANDPVGQVIQCARALRADGLFLSAAFGGQTLSGLRTALAEAEVAVTGGLSPRVAPMAEVRDMGAVLQRAGLALPVADTVPLTVGYADFTALLHDLRAMGETNALADRLQRPTRRAVFAEAAARYTASHQTGVGRITAQFDLVFLTGWAPDASQPQPLRPGSATMRLAQALGTDETSLPD